MLEEVWGVREDTDTRAIDNFIVRLRRYIERGAGATAAPAHGAGGGLPVHRGAEAAPTDVEQEFATDYCWTCGSLRFARAPALSGAT